MSETNMPTRTFDLSTAATGTWTMALAAVLGAAVSAYNYLTPLTGIDGTPGALLVIASSLLLAAFSMILMRPSGRGLRLFIATASFLNIAGTAFAAYLLESHLLLGLMGVCLIGLASFMLRRSPAAA